MVAVDRIVTRAHEKLGHSSYLYLRTVRCDYGDGILTMNGKVPSFYLKQTAQSLMQDIDGVKRIDNRLEVVNPYGVSSEPLGV